MNIAHIDLTVIRLPRRFLDDHDERLCDAEDVPRCVRIRETNRFAWVRRGDPGLSDLISDAQYYRDVAVPGGLTEGYEWVGHAAKRLLAALKAAGVGG